MLNDLVFNICMALVVAIFGLIAKELIPFIKEKYSETLKSIESTKWAWAVEIVDAVVRAVEQTVIDQHGEDKKLIAKRWIQHIMKDSEIYLSNEQVDMLIEAAVQAMNREVIGLDGEGTQE